MKMCDLFEIPTGRRSGHFSRSGVNPFKILMIVFYLYYDTLVMYSKYLHAGGSEHAPTIGKPFVTHSRIPATLNLKPYTLNPIP